MALLCVTLVCHPCTCMLPLCVTHLCHRCVSPLYVTVVCHPCVSPCVLPLCVTHVCHRCVSPLCVTLCVTPVYHPVCYPCVSPLCVTPVCHPLYLCISHCFTRHFSNLYNPTPTYIHTQSPFKSTLIHGRLLNGARVVANLSHRNYKKNSVCGGGIIFYGGSFSLCDRFFSFYRGYFLHVMGFFPSNESLFGGPPLQMFLRASMPTPHTSIDYHALTPPYPFTPLSAYSFRTPLYNIII